MNFTRCGAYEITGSARAMLRSHLSDVMPVAPYERLVGQEHRTAFTLSNAPEAGGGLPEPDEFRISG